MGTEVTQDGRLLVVDTPLGKDVLVIDSFTGSEAVSEPFHLDVTLLADVPAGNDRKVDPVKLVGEPMTIHVELAGGKTRFFHGIVRRFNRGAASGRFATFRAELVPSLWLLSLRSNSRFFQDLTVPEVLEKVFKENGLTDFRLSLTRTYTKWDYCCQYRETDLTFVSRLMEEEGIWYYFEHEATKHTLVLMDKASSYKACPNQPTAFLDTTAATDGEDTMSGWEERQELFPGKYTLGDFHFELPRNALQESAEASDPPKATKSAEMYDWPGGHAQRFNKQGDRLGDVATEGGTLATLRMNEAQGSKLVVEGTSNCRAFTPGFKITVDTRTSQRISGSFCLSAVQHSVRQSPGYDSAEDADTGGYENRFVCVPAATPLHPARLTPKPIVNGPHTARVVDESKSGETEEIWPDKFGRVRVRFPWDRDGKFACWLRVAQQRAGKSGGAIFIPRVGDEVLVSFLEGDPDCPIIIGSLYNSDNPPPYTLPANKTQSGWKTRSTMKGGTENFNELRFEDKKDAEEILLHAEKVLKVEVEADEFRTVGANRTTTIQKDDKRINKEGDEITIIEKGSMGTKIKTDFEMVVEEGLHATSVDKGDCTLFVGQGVYEVQVDQGDMAVEVNTGNLDVLVGTGNMNVDVDTGNLTINVKTGNLETNVKTGNAKTKVSVGTYTIEAMQGIELKCGSNSIKIDMTGITIKGMMVKIEGTVQTSIKGLMTEVKGDAMLQAKGAITMIG